MRIAVSTVGNDLDAPFSPMFGRCPVHLLVEVDTMDFQAVRNEAMGAAGGAGIQAAQEMVNRGAMAVITGHVGPNAHRVLSSAGVPIYTFNGATVRDAVEAYKAGRLAAVDAPTGPAHAGMGAMRGAGMGPNAGGRGGRGFGPPVSTPLPQPQAPAGASSGQSDDLAGLKAEMADLRNRLGKIADRLERL